MNVGNMGGIYQYLNQHEEALSQYSNALSLSKEIGDRVHEGINLGNMGDALINLNRTEEAQRLFVDAITICDKRFPIAAGAFRGSLALLMMHNLQREQSHALLEKGEPQVKVYPEEYGKFLCKKAQIHRLSQQDSIAQEAFEQAQKIAKNIGIEEDSGFSKLIKETAKVLFD